MSARRFVAVLLVLMVGAVAAASAQTQTVYNSIPKPLAGNVASLGPEAYAFAELGDGLSLNANTGTIGQVTVIMSSFACVNGHWTAGCVTPLGATFSQSVTINLYSVTDDIVVSPPAVAAPLGTITQTFNLPYRPSADPGKCPDAPTKWYSTKDKSCYNGFAFPIVVNFSGQHIATPPTGRIIVTVAYNSTHYGPSPIGESAACFGTVAGCFYDSLNIGAESDGVFPGFPIDPSGIFVRWGAGPAGNALLYDGPGWNPNHPQIQVQVNTNATPHTKGNAP